MRNLMTSAHWPESISVGGILSSRKEENPFYYNANHVFIPYCSSDGWSGDSPAKSSKDLSFSGSIIIENVIKKLVSNGLFDAKTLFLAGSSAGAGGVLINIDKIADLLKSLGSKVKLRGLVDSGWFLDSELLKYSFANNLLYKKMESNCFDGSICSPLETIKKGFKMWNSQVPDSCKANYLKEPWKCFFGYKIHATLKSPIFIIQWLFDEAQMTIDNVSSLTTKSQLDYIYKLGMEIRRSLENVTGIFAPSCISHTFLTRQNWAEIKINGFSLPEAIRCWEFNQDEINLQANSLVVKKKSLTFDDALFERNDPDFNKPGSNELVLLPPNLETYSSFYKSMQISSLNNILSNKKKFNKKSHQFLSSKSKYFSKKKSDFSFRCSPRLFDSCTWPQCNSQCPKLKNSFRFNENL